MLELDTLNEMDQYLKEHKLLLLTKRSKMNSPITTYLHL